jgi:hypothetical protein
MIRASHVHCFSMRTSSDQEDILIIWWIRMILKELTRTKYRTVVIAREVEEDSEKFKSFYSVRQESFKFCALLSKQDLSFIQNVVFPNKFHKFNVFFCTIACMNSQGILKPVSFPSCLEICLRLKDRRHDMLSRNRTLSACREYIVISSFAVCEISCETKLILSPSCPAWQSNNIEWEDAMARCWTFLFPESPAFSHGIGKPCGATRGRFYVTM